MWENNKMVKITFLQLLSMIKNKKAPKQVFLGGYEFKRVLGNYYCTENELVITDWFDDLYDMINDPCIEIHNNDVNKIEKITKVPAEHKINERLSVVDDKSMKINEIIDALNILIETYNNK